MKSVVKESSAARFKRIHKTLRERICLLHYPPGTVLNETDLATEFAVSRTPLRRVLQRLNYEGLVEITNGVGTIVTDIDMKTFKDIYDLRMLLAEAMGALSPKPATKKHISAIDRLIEKAGLLPGEKDIEKYARNANELHGIIIDLIGSIPLQEITDILYYRVARIWFIFLPNLDWSEVIQAQLSELREMREALLQNDIQSVGRIRSKKLRDILENISDYLAHR